MSLYQNQPTNPSGFNNENHPELRTLIYKDNSILGILIVQLDMTYYQKNLNDIKIFFRIYE